MLYGEIKDAVREYAGRVGWSSVMLNQALDSARRAIEQQGNYYWMRTSNTFDTTASTQSYSIPDPMGDINLPRFKDLRSLHIKETGQTLWQPLEVGIQSLEEAKLLYTTDEEAMPQLAVIDNTDLWLFPTPDAVYNLEIFHWEWTSNLSNLETDELSQFWPEALIYGALVCMCDQFEKEPQEADRWRAIFNRELRKIQDHDFERERDNIVSLKPMRGPFAQRHVVSSNSRQTWL